VEACHIEPFAHRQLCALYNGIALSPDIHKLFDAHYLTVDEDYRVVVSTNIQEITETPFYKPLQGQKLRLPIVKSYGRGRSCWRGIGVVLKDEGRMNGRALGWWRQGIFTTSSLLEVQWIVPQAVILPQGK
jgi:hypothetical protein